MFDYGAPTGFRLAVKHPERITAIISQNGNAYEEGLSDGWNPIRAYWQDPSAANREALRAFLKPETTVWQYTHGVPDPTRVSPDGYTLDNFYMSRPGVADVQLDLMGDYKSNVALYPTFQQLFPHPQAAVAGGVGQERSLLPAAGRRGVQARHPERDACASSTPDISRWRRMRRRSRRRSATSFPADLAQGRDHNGDVSRDRHRREPGHWPVDGHSPCARFLRARSRRAGPGEPGEHGGGGEGRGRKSARDRSDLSQPTAAKGVVDQALAAFGRIDALLNIAGAVPQIDLFEMTDAQWEAGLALKLHGARRLTIAAWPALKAAKGAVVLMSGNSALFPKAPYAAVGTINAAIVALAKAFSDRGIADGVQVNSVLPGPVMTGRRRSYLEHWAALHNMTVEEATANFPKEAGIARYGEPEEIAELMAFLVSPGARWMTGSALRMDGGEVKSI